MSEVWIAAGAVAALACPAHSLWRWRRDGRAGCARRREAAGSLAARQRALAADVRSCAARLRDEAARSD